MFSSNIKIQSIVEDFRIDKMIRYSNFVPRLYNFCRSLGFEKGKIMPSLAFCSDENQGFPIILITKHFGTFPFNHGKVGGIVDIYRHVPHAHHGKDVLIIQASHVGYDPKSKTFGNYRRLQTDNNKNTSTCGKIGSIIEWYEDEYAFAQNNIFLYKKNGLYLITIDNQLLNEKRRQGLFLNLEKLLLTENNEYKLHKILSTSKTFIIKENFLKTLPKNINLTEKKIKIGNNLTPDLFTFKRDINLDKNFNQLENNILKPMPWIVTSKAPLLTAAQINTQAEFDRTFRSILKEKEYQDKKLLFMSCLNIDISPQENQVFPLTKCIPWAAYAKNCDIESSHTIEQDELIDRLLAQNIDNSEQIDLEKAINLMANVPEIKVDF